MATPFLTPPVPVTILVSWRRPPPPCTMPSITPRALCGAWRTRRAWITPCWSVFDPGNAKRLETLLRKSLTPWRIGPVSANRRNALFVAP